MRICCHRAIFYILRVRVEGVEGGRRGMVFTAPLVFRIVDLSKQQGKELSALPVREVVI